MKLSFVLGAAGFTPDRLESKCVITLENGQITASDITVVVTVPGITADQFDACAADAKANCPVSKLFNCAISLNATLA
jgi:osmotically inducible protein OsmC